VFDRRGPSEARAATFGDDPGVTLRLGAEPPALGAAEWARLDAVVVSPGVPADRPLLASARAQGVPVLGEVELAAAFVDGPLVGVTGSNGKSTTVAMIGAMLAAAGRDARVCGNFGPPLAAAVPRPSEAVAGEGALDEAARPHYVVELSSFQLETIVDLRPRAAAFLNVAADHLDRHGDLDTYTAAKRRIFENQQGGDVAVLNADDPRVRHAGDDLREGVHRRFFSSLGRVADGCCVRDDEIVEIDAAGGETTLFRRSDLTVGGPHNVENAMAAALLARALGVGSAEIVTGLRQMEGLAHRMQRVGQHGGVAWIDDSKGTNPAATLRSLDGFEAGTVIVVLGGQHKGGDLAPLAERVALTARRALLIGEAAPTFATALAATDAAFETVETLDRAVERAAEIARAGDVVLLSPACASFDQFSSFVDRGRTFQRLVHAVASREDG
ncbi:MAG: UDP-N-acetylmuramoyl-L-alanine--D-glutamate ligase, partial [Acidobacteriota bacterium]